MKMELKKFDGENKNTKTLDELTAQGYREVGTVISGNDKYPRYIKTNDEGEVEEVYVVKDPAKGIAEKHNETRSHHDGGTFNLSPF